jgi:hypothetical protein
MDIAPHQKLGKENTMDRRVSLVLLAMLASIGCTRECGPDQSFAHAPCIDNVLEPGRVRAAVEESQRLVNLLAQRRGMAPVRPSELSDPLPGVADDEVLTRVYDVRDISAAMTASVWTSTSVRQMVRQIPPADSWTDGNATLTEFGGQLVIRQSAAVHRRIYCALERLRKGATQCVSFETQVISMPTSTAGRIPIQWKPIYSLSPLTLTEADPPESGWGRPIAPDLDAPVGRAAMATRSPLLLQAAVIGDRMARLIEDVADRHPRGKTLSVPRAVAWNGEKSCVGEPTDGSYYLDFADVWPNNETNGQPPPTPSIILNLCGTVSSNRRFIGLEVGASLTGNGERQPQQTAMASNDGKQQHSASPTRVCQALVLACLPDGATLAIRGVRFPDDPVDVEALLLVTVRAIPQPGTTTETGDTPNAPPPSPEEAKSE